jgi:hypothetical protein
MASLAGMPSRESLMRAIDGVAWDHLAHAHSAARDAPVRALKNTLQPIVLGHHSRVLAQGCRVGQRDRSAASLGTPDVLPT